MAKVGLTDAVLSPMNKDITSTEWVDILLFN